MARFGLFAVVMVILAVSMQQAIALKCWDCNSLQTPGCADPFSKDKVPTHMNANCTGTLLGQPSCVKIKATSSGQVIRKCVGSQIERKITCQFGDLAADVCEFCESDGCNGAAQYGPIAMMIIAIPIAIVKLFSE